jgi:hypothetical protein
MTKKFEPPPRNSKEDWQRYFNDLHASILESQRGLLDTIIKISNKP